MKLESWGRYPKYPQAASPVWWPQQLDAAALPQSFLPFGNGRSYGDVCLASSNQLLTMRGLDRFVAFDRQTGVLRAEAGVTLGDILQVTVPAGWFLPVVPGTRLATLGGAIANDVHGKNHHRQGTFGCHVNRFTLYRQGQWLECSPQQEPDVFAATIGGLGLTGIIVAAEIQLMPIKTGQIDTVTQRFDRLEDFFRLANDYDLSHQYGVAWIDCLARGSRQGRGVYFAGNHAEYESPMTIHQRQLAIPLTPPLSLVNRVSLKVFNELYWYTKPKQPVVSREPYPGYFFPLDGIQHWNRLYGRNGFQQYQCVIPDNGATDAMRELLSAIADAQSGSFLAVMKKCGDVSSPGLLSFPLAGTSLALDFPQSSKTEKLFERLDAITRSAGGRLYPAKDAHMSAADFQSFYPQWQALDALRDPSISSHFWKRVTL
ncbi:FAD-binding protein [Candidatus Thalassolituus haligoni]|jgi:FAD/FMN-containing dehydrogenase|uniref:FAD-binding oxidoreductase n=1 Tax=Candidatus Thalassolituus haligoni TaxID=3100113 RepID=UPI0035111C1B|tara:strand:+ start:2662 stop:3951 length:1290 start_codon:yes stop_codon:yes gene_type:complete